MTAPDVDPFAEDPITRDQYGRPRIIGIKRGKPDLKGKPIAYTRASTFCDALSDAGGLLKWSKWHLALGLGRNPDLAALAGVFGPTVDDLSRGDKQALDAIIERAHDRSGGNVKADYGTVVHAYTEPGALDVPNPFDGDEVAIAELHALIVASVLADTAAYQAALTLHGLETVDTEQFVVNDELQVAGTYDHQVRLSRDLSIGSVTLPAGTLLILDKKTGKLHFDSQCIQLAVYANAKRYNPETGERAELGASYEWGILAHIPKGEARCDLYLIDLRVGWAAAKLAGKVREHRTRKDIATLFPTPDPEPVAPALSIVATDNASTVLQGVADGVIHIGKGRAVPEGIAASVSQPLGVSPVVRAVAEMVDDENEAALATIRDIFGDVTPVLTVIEKLNAAASRDELSDIWRSVPKPEWTDEYTAALRARAAQIDKAA